VGEVRGAEVSDLLAALNTGHEGGAGTLHANGPEEVPARLEALGSLAGMPRDAVHAQLRGALDVVVHVVRDHRGRRVERVGVPRAGPDGVVGVRTALVDDGTAVRRGPAWDGLAALVPAGALRGVVLDAAGAPP
jgi:pilus assembly protein CpaF